MGRIVTWCKHCYQVISHKCDESIDENKDEYQECAACKRKKDELKNNKPKEEKKDD